jgi:hypothetical protein
VQGSMTRRLHELDERQRELQRLVVKAVESGEPVFMGVWGPTGHTLYITAKPEASPLLETEI